MGQSKLTFANKSISQLLHLDGSIMVMLEDSGIANSWLQRLFSSMQKDTFTRISFVDPHVAVLFQL